MAMNLSLSKLPWYAQLGAFVALALAASACSGTSTQRPRRRALPTRRRELASLHATTSTAVWPPRGGFRSSAASRRLQAQLDRLRAVLPEERDVADLLRRVQAMATQSNLTIRGFTPQAVATRELHAEWPIGLQLEGTYHDLGAFLERVSKFPRIINVTGIAIRATRHEHCLRQSRSSADCTATTFVLIDPQAGCSRRSRPRAGRGARGAGGRCSGTRPGVRADLAARAPCPSRSSIVMLLGASSPAEAQAAAPQAKSSAEPAKAAPPSPGKPQPAAGKQTASPSGKVPAPKASQTAGASNAAAQPPTTDQLVEPPGFTYKPEGRRDPFVSLVRRGSSSRASAPSLRPPGLGGLSVEEITLRGTFEVARASSASLRAPIRKPTSCGRATNCSTARSARSRKPRW